MTKTLKLSPEDVTKISQYEASIAHWSSEYTVLTLKAKKTLEGIDNLYMARQKALDDFLASNDIPANTVQSLNLGADGEITVVLKTE
jgi:hypothetical protein